MSEPVRRTVVTVQIAGEDYTIRTDESDEYTRDCARFVDRTVRDIIEGATSLPPHKASVLAAMAITDQLFKAQREAETARAAAAGRARALTAEIARHLEPGSLATAS